MVLRRLHQSLNKEARGAEQRPTWLLFLVALVLLALSTACSLGQAVVGSSQALAAATATKTPQPTFTPLPLIAPTAAVLPIRGELPPGVTVPAPTPTVAISDTFDLSLGKIHVVLYATATPGPPPTAGPTVLSTATPEPTLDVETNRPTRPAGPRPLPTPFIVVHVEVLNGRRGPALTFPQIGQVERGAELMILGKTAVGDWWWVCCMANQPVWVPADAVTANGPLNAIPVLTPAATPTTTPVPTPVPTPTPRPTPLPPFDIARGPEFPIQVNNNILTIWAKIYEGSGDYEKPLGGYVLKVFRDGVDVSTDRRSMGDRFDEIVSVSGTVRTVQYVYNLKFELRDAGEADWEIYLARPGGLRVSPITRFTTKGASNRNLVVFVAYWLAR